MKDFGETLYRYHDPTPPEVAEVLGISAQHVKDLCRELGLPMVDKKSPSSTRHSWTIPRESFDALVTYLRKGLTPQSQQR